MTDLELYTFVIAPLLILALGAIVALSTGWLERHGL